MHFIFARLHDILQVSKGTRSFCERRKELTQMKFTFTEKKMGSSADLRAYAERKVGKLDRLFKTESNAYLTFSTERGRLLAEITIENDGFY